MNWKDHASAVVTDINAAFGDTQAKAAGHLQDAIDNLQRAIDALEENE